MVSTPYMDEAAMCDRIALIQEGKIMAIDTPDSIIKKFPYPLYAVKADNNYHLLEKLKTQKNIRSCYISGEYLHVIFKEENKDLEYPNTEIKEIAPTIEDCFIQLMNYENN